MTDTARDTAMPAEIAKLVERLRIPWPPDGSGDEVTLPVWVFELMNEAATAILALQGERDEQWRRANVLAQQNAYHKDRAEAAEARVAELEKALEPFAEIAGEPWADENGWTNAACQNDRICDWFGPSAFRTARRVREGGKVE